MLDLFSSVILFCCFTCVIFTGLGLYYERREIARYAGERGKATFLCVRCDRIYSVAVERMVCSCPQCGWDNVRLKF